MVVKDNFYLTKIVFWYILGFLHIGLFLYNFFPIKPKSSTVILQPPEHLNDIRFDINANYPNHAEKIILVVIDALRYDFITEHNMPYIYSEINKPTACLLCAKAEPPTVTMPRIKALTTGSVPQFIDLILNFASQEITDDSFLHRAKQAGKKMIFYGDNTWLKLFSKMFTRYEGTTSFFVTDFTEVDNNVTRHLQKELTENTDWDLMFLHYLGLDHIGHVHGPFHPLISKKLQEMDDIVNKIHTAVQLENKKTVILICGDHGMKDAGGHGGSTDPETLVPLVFLGTSCNKTRIRHKEITQTDVAPTLAVLMALPLPADNIGKIIFEIMDLTISEQLYYLYYNALNLLQKDYDKYIHEFQDIFDNHANYLQHQIVNPQQLMEKYELKISELSLKLIKSSTVQNIPLLYLSLSTLTIILCALVFIERQVFFIQIYFVSISIIIISYIFLNTSALFLAIILYCFIPLVILLSNIVFLLPLFSKLFTSPILLFLFAGTVIRTILLISSSFIEEEHQIWYFLWGTIAVLNAYQEIRIGKHWFNIIMWMSLFIGLRIIRCLNHVGLRDTGHDISDWLNLPNHSNWLLLIFIIGLMGTIYCCNRIFNNSKTIKIFSFLTAVAIFWYQLALRYTKYNILEARAAMILIIITGIVSFQSGIFRTLCVMWMLWISLLMRPHNIFLIPICFGSSKMLFKLCSSEKCLIFLHIWLSYVLFHCQGFSNSLSSVDISPGYVGLSEYSFVFASFQILCHTYAFPVLSMFLFFIQSKVSEHVNFLYTVVILRLFSICWYCLVILIHRQHLFIWSVFSPKLLIESCHALCLLIALCSYLLISKTCLMNKTLHQY